MENKEKKSKNKKRSYKIFIYFLIFELFFTAATAPFVIFHGPFKNVKKTMVGAAMTTLKHQYIAKIFLSDTEIKKILSEDSIQTVTQNKNSVLKFENKHDSTIERYDISYGKKFKGYMLVVHDPTRVKVGYSSKLGVQGELTSQIARNKRAVAAINAGGFTDKSANSKWTGTGGNVEGVIISNGEVKYNSDKGGNFTGDVAAITKKGALLVGNYSLDKLKKLNVQEAITFGPALVVNGEGTIDSGDGGWGIAPRTAIGQRKDGAILMLAIDGRQASSLGATLKDVQDIMLQYDAYTATNLDGGSSTTMYHEGEIINNPANSLGERSVPSILYVEP
ncbi:phosphodiester glycosidase family protein [Clostridium sp. Marseille-Q2269]|uniref:phosphodiester glycosidase family protein n=1 Tax=Clostridium sp. Marseille-Q2269 TaxID=2942205 RepID=UPI0020731087|nr:phosphodiester glycosidase family protein [Clostridium sp. Marseille-Q2269]